MILKKLKVIERCHYWSGSRPKIVNYNRQTNGQECRCDGTYIKSRCRDSKEGYSRVCEEPGPCFSFFLPFSFDSPYDESPKDFENEVPK